MGLIQAGLAVTFATGNAVANVVRFKRLVSGLVRTTTLYQAAADKAGVELNQLLRIQANEKAPTRFQRNIRLANQSVRTGTTAVKELRLGLKLFGIGATKASKKTRGLSRHVKVVRKEMTKMAPVVRSVRMGFAQTFSVIAGGLASIAGVRLFGDVTQMGRAAIRLAGNAESAKVTFDALLGDQAKSAELMRRITQFSGGTPFQRSDIIEGSKLLLNVTKDNIDQNEKLFKLAANLAALKPGTKVADVSRAIFSATVGETAALKSLGVVLRAEQFKGAGEVGGETYAKAVIKEIESQFRDKTGGRDLVGALSATLQGKVSTLIDNLEIFGQFVGEKIIDAVDLKPLLDKVITTFQDLTFALQVMFGNVKLDEAAAERFLGIDDGILAVARFVKSTFVTFLRIKDFVVNKVIEPVAKAFNSLSLRVKGALVGIGFAAAGSLAGVSIVTPIITTIGILVGGLMAVLSPFATFIIPAIKAAFAGLLGIMLPITTMFGIAAFAFLMFKKRGESVGEALLRLRDIFKSMIDAVIIRFKAFLGPFIKEVMPQARENIRLMFEAIDEARVLFHEFFGLFANRSNVAPIEDFAELGRQVGKAFAFAIKWGAIFSLRTVGKLIQVLKLVQPLFRSTASDIHALAKSFFSLVTGSNRSLGALRTFGLGLADVITLPFRIALFNLTFMIETALTKLADKVAPFNKRIAGNIRQFAEGMDNLREDLNEGFLKTQFEFQVDFVGPEQGTPVQMNMDGEKVGEGLMKTELRQRHSGRGGDPPNVEELGFMINSEGTRIRGVTLEEAASRFN